MSDKNNAAAASGGIGLFGLLTAMFVYLKLTHQIDWAWGWVVAPLWMPASAVIAVMLVVFVGYVACAGVSVLWRKATRPPRPRR